MRGSLPFVVAFTPRVHLLQSIPLPNFRQSLEGRKDHQIMRQHSSLDEWPRCLALWFALLALPISFLSEPRGVAGMSAWACRQSRGRHRTVFAPNNPEKHNAFCYQGAPQFFLAFTLFSLLTEFTICLFTC